MGSEKKCGRFCQEEAFTLTEILVAGVILVLALLPVINMFDTSFKGILGYERIHKATNCAREAIERIRAIPFYEPYDSRRGDTDIDDLFWTGGGRRSTEPTFNPDLDGDGVPDWELIDEVVYYDYGKFRGYKEFQVKVQLAYLEDDTSVAVMWPQWRPKLPGSDRPKNSRNDLIHLLLVRVNVYWKSGGETRSQSLEQVVTSTDTVYNVGVSSIQVLSPDSVRDPELTNAASHYPNVDIRVRITGYGFQAPLRAFLVRPRHNDIEITGITLSTGGDGVSIAEGTLRLYNTGTDTTGTGELNFYPRASVGHWSVRILQQDIVNAYLYNGFIVQYPRATVTDVYNTGTNPKVREGKTDQTSARLTFEGLRFVNKVENPTPVLVSYDSQGNVTAQVVGTVENVSNTNNGYSESSCTLVARFDFTSAAPGVYRAVVYNTRADGSVGHVASAPSSQTYTVVAVPPLVNNVYVFGTTQLRSVYRNIGGGINRLVIEGVAFNSVTPPYVEVYLSNSTTAGDPTKGSYTKGTVLELGPTRIVADFNVSGLQLASNYNVFVRNQNNDLWGWITTPSPRVTVKDFSGSITGFSPTADGFWENYFDVPAVVTGSGLDAAIKVTIASTDGTEEYEDIAYTVTSSNRIDVVLNLIGCNHKKGWEVRVYITPTYFMSRGFTITLGRSVILAPQRTALYALSISRRSGPGGSIYTSDEYISGNTLYRAYARRGWQARFTVRGKGFPLPGNGTVTLRIWRDGWSGLSGQYTCVYDRAQRTVTIISDWWNMPNQTGDAHISVVRSGTGDSPDQHLNRWVLRSN